MSLPVRKPAVAILKSEKAVAKLSGSTDHEFVI